jgi:ABC-type sugar transport system ATPase subunit
MNRILGDISLEVGDGELLVLVGPSGCGKTTLLRCIAGLEEPSRGEIAIDGRSVVDVPPRDRDIAMVFQSYALYPHMTVFDNLAFGLRMRKTPAAEIKRLVDEAAQMLEIGHLIKRYPRELSGGQRQRVAMGRAVVRRPKVFLFDEPLSNLDAALRQQMRLELLRLHRRLSATMVYVTHDQVEAMTLADRIAVLKQGELVQVGAPAELYNQPCNTFVARFFGTPEMNLIPGVIDNGEFVASDRELKLRVAAAGYPSGPVSLGIRAEDLAFKRGAAGQITARVDVVEHLGSEDLIHLDVGATRLVVRCATAGAPAQASEVAVQVPAAHCHFFAQAPGGREGARLQPPAPAASLGLVS